MKTILVIALLLLTWPLTAGRAIGQETIRATTDTGKEVVLYADGTWKHATAVASKPTPLGLRKPTSATKLFKSDRAGFGIWYDEAKWQLSPKFVEPGRTEFNLRRGDGYAIAIVEEIEIPISSLKKIALENAKEADPEAKIVFEETRVVNGKEVLCMRIDGTMSQIPFRFYGYYYGGKQGTIQLLTYTGQSLFQKYEQDFLDFLNGLEIY
jgi:hypothetical protein